MLDFEYVENEIILREFGSFSLKNTFACGQCFRWKEQNNGSFSGVAGGRNVNISYDGVLHIKGAKREDIEFWINFLDITRDYDGMCDVFKGLDINMKKAVDFAQGLRLLKQPFFETLISFIFSQNNNVPRITGIIEKLCRSHGQQIDEDVFSFPNAETMASLDVNDISKLGAGYRSEYVTQTSRLFASGSFDFETLKSADLQEAREIMQRFPGVGPKVADCVLLYSGTNHEAFPTDVWVKRVMEELYLGKSMKNSDIMKFASEYFGSVAGFAQQYLFHYARMNKIGTGNQTA